MQEKLGIPYMGSKRRISQQLMKFMLKENPKAKYFYDLFGGGGAMSFQALQTKRFEKIYYNEFDKAVSELMKSLLVNGVPNEYYKWRNKPEVEKLKKEDTALGGMCSIVWLFGNNRKNYYLYAEELREDKELMHNIIVNKDEEALKQINKKYNINIPLKIKQGLSSVKESVRARRLRVLNYIKKSVKEEHSHLYMLEHLSRVDQLNRIPQTDKIVVSNKSYEEVEIKTPVEETIIYLDPPYQDTRGYKSEIDYDAFYEFVNKSPYQIYVSSYDTPLKEVFQIKHDCIVNPLKKRTVTEKLYSNK